MLTATTVTGGVLAAAVLAVEAGQDSAVTVALIGAIGGFAGVLVTGIVALLRDRKPQPDPSRHIPETADTLAAEMHRVDGLLHDLRQTRAEADLWQQRAYEAGWRP